MVCNFLWEHVLKRDWQWINMIKVPKVLSLPDILTVSEVEQLIAATRKLRYRVFLLTTYSMGFKCPKYNAPIRIFLLEGLHGHQDKHAYAAKTQPSTQSREDTSSFDINLWFFKASSQAKVFARPKKRIYQTRTFNVSPSKKIFAYMKPPLHMPGSSKHRIDCGSLCSHNLPLFISCFLMLNHLQYNDV